MLKMNARLCSFLGCSCESWQGAGGPLTSPQYFRDRHNDLTVSFAHRKDEDSMLVNAQRHDGTWQHYLAECVCCMLAGLLRVVIVLQPPKDHGHRLLPPSSPCGKERI